MANSVRRRSRFVFRPCFDQLEDRSVPAYLVYSTGEPFAVAGVADNQPHDGFRLRPDIVTVSDAYRSANGRLQLAESSPATFSAISTPTETEWNLLTGSWGIFAWVRAQQILEDNSLKVESAEALGPSRLVPGARPPSVAQSLFLQYNATGRDPTPQSVHWVQFVTTNAPVSTQPSGTPFIDNGGDPTPFYDAFGGTADGRGFFDLPKRHVRDTTITWHADLFLVQEIRIGFGFPIEVVWQGVSWGFDTVRAANRPPNGFANAVTTPENTPYVFTAADFGFTDPENPPDSFVAVKITSLPAAGSLTDNGMPVSAGDYVSASDINSGLLAFTPGLNATGAPYAYFTFQVEDDGDTSDGGQNLDPIPKSMSINVMPTSWVNHAPYGADNTVTTLENTPYPLSTVDFGFSDPNDNPPNNLSFVQITSIPSGGTLTDNGIALSAGSLVSAYDIEEGLLIYTPDVDSGGDPYDAFQFKVQDDGGTFNGGSDTDPVARAMTINVTMVNQPPQGTDNTVNTLQNTPYVFSAADFGFSDPDDSPPDNLQAVRITTLPSFGSLTSNGVAVNPGDYISVNDINSGQLVFTPDTDVGGVPLAGFRFQVQDDGGTAEGALDTDTSLRKMLINVYVRPTIIIGEASQNEGNSGDTSFVFTINLSNATYQTVTVDYATADSTATTADNDYTIANRSVTFAPGETSKTIIVSVKGDTKYEPDETFLVNLSNPTNATISNSQGTGTIVNDDSQPTISINDVSQNEGNSGTTSFVFTVSLSNASYQAITVDYATANGTATAGSDYTSASGTVTFSPGETSKTITISVTGDTTYEPNETFFVNLTNPTNATIADSQGQGTIVNDDGQPTISINDVTQNEGSGPGFKPPWAYTSFTFTVSLSNASADTITVQFSTSDGTALAGSDYLTNSGTLTFQPGQTSLTVTVYVIADRTHENNETFFVNLSNAFNATILDSQGLGTIVNDD